MDNSNTWIDIYDTTDFGNKWASSYLASLFCGRIKPMLMERTGKEASDINVLDFGCSMGANAQIFKTLGMNVYGIDVSSKAVSSCMKCGLGDSSHFKAVNLLNGRGGVKEVFYGVRFDFVLASECMYYFTNRERSFLVKEFYQSMSDAGILYVSMPSYDCSLYREYRTHDKNENGMIKIKKSGSIQHELSVNLPEGRKEMKEMFLPFRAIDLLVTNMQRFSNVDEIEYHLIAEKQRAGNGKDS